MAIDPALPTISESYRDIVGVQIIIHEYTVIASFGEELAMPLGTKGYASSSIHSGFVDGVRGNDHVGGYCRGVKAEERIIPRESRQGRLCKFLSAAVKSSPTDQINIEVRAWREMHDGIERGGEYVDIAAWKPDVVKGSAVNSKAIVIDLDHGAYVLVEVKTNTALNVPAFVKVPAGVPDGLSEAPTDCERELGYLLGTDGSDDAK